MTEENRGELATLPQEEQEVALSTQEAEPLLAERVVKALAEVQPATLDGFHPYHKYRYTTIGQIRSLANRALARAGIAVFPSVIEVRRQETVGQKGTTILQTAVRMSFTIVSPEGRFSVQWFGESDDTSDKGVSKAITAATKSFLLNFLLVPMAQAKEEVEGAREAKEEKEHWIARPEVRRRFWAWTKNTLALTEAQVHQALGVESVYQFDGTMQEAKERIEAWIDQQVTGEALQDELDALFGPESEPAEEESRSAKEDMEDLGWPQDQGRLL